MANNYNDTIKIRRLIEALHMFALYDMSARKLNSLIKSAKDIDDLIGKIFDTHRGDE